MQHIILHDEATAQSTTVQGHQVACQLAAASANENEVQSVTLISHLFHTGPS